MPIGGGPAVAISGTLGAGGDVKLGFLVLQHSDAVLFRSDRAQNSVQELWLARLDGRGQPTRCSALSHPEADVQADFLLAPDEKFVYYRADALVDERVEFFRYPLEHEPPPARR